MTDYEFRLFCSELERYADGAGTETYVVCAADQLAAEGIDHLPHPECANATWSRIDTVLDDNTTFTDEEDAP